MAEPSFKDLAYRALASTIGGPVDIATMFMRPFGYNVPPEQVFGSSEYLGRQLEQGGLVSEARDPTQEFLASMMVPSPNLPIKAVGMLPEIAAGLMGLGMMRNVGSVDDLRRTADQLKQESSRLREIYQQSPTQENMQRYLDANEQRLSLIDQIAEMSDTRPTQTIEQQSYRGMHTAPMRDSGAPLSQLDQVYPDDIYSRQAVDFYGTGSPRDKAVFNKVQRFRNKPEADVTIYRAVPKDLPEGTDINRGDWVTIDKQYAKDHGESVFDGDYKIIEKKVKAKDIYTNADSIYEFGYDPDVQEMSDAIRKGLLD